MKTVNTKLLPDKEPADFSAPQVFVDQKPKPIRIEHGLIETTTLADLIDSIGNRSPKDVEVEYAGCGSHAIELILED